MTWTHEHSGRLEAPPAQVFTALTEPVALRQWFAEQVDVLATPGGRYRFWGKHTLGAPAERDAQQPLTRLEPGRALALAMARALRCTITSREICRW